MTISASKSVSPPSRASIGPIITTLHTSQKGQKARALKYWRLLSGEVFLRSYCTQVWVLMAMAARLRRTIFPFQASARLQPEIKEPKAVQ